MTSRPDRLVAGRYRLGRMLGAGGMGTVWQARDELLGRDVAIKEVQPPPELTAGEQDLLRQRTMREASTAARISHPNVITVYDVVEAEHRPWIVMELVRARSLSEVIRADGPLPPHRVAQIGLDLLAALRVAHAAGVLHRDVKPGNVLLRTDGRVVLTDFGIATLAGDPSLTRSGMLLGAPAYIAPERARGGRGGPPSDLWSLGATLYTAVEGRPPYNRGGPLPTLTAVVSEDPDPTRLAGGLRPVLEGLLRRQPERRLTASEAEALLRPMALKSRASSAAPVRPAAPPRELPGQPTRAMAVPVARPADRTAPPDPPVPGAATAPGAGAAEAGAAGAGAAEAGAAEAGAAGAGVAGAGVAEAGAAEAGAAADPAPTQAAASQQSDQAGAAPAGTASPAGPPAPEPGTPTASSARAGDRATAGRDSGAAKPAQPAKPTEPATPVKQARPAKPTKPATPAKPTEPAQPAKPTEPATPVEQARPAARVGRVAPPPTVPKRPAGRPARRLVAALAAAALLGVVAVVAVLSRGDSTPGAARANPPAPTSSSRAAGGPAGGTGTASSPNPAPASTGPAGGSTAPAGRADLVQYHSSGPTGTYTVLRPVGWSVSTRPSSYGGSVVFTSPDGRRSLLIDHARIAAPDALADLQAKERTRANTTYPSYHKIRLARTAGSQRARIAGPQFADEAVWEFQFTKGVRMHAQFTNVITGGSGGAYGILWRGPDAGWPDDQAILRQIELSFRPSF